MTTTPRRLLQTLSKRWVGERPVPVGGLAQDRDLLRRAFLGHPSERVLVVGPGLAVRQTVPGARVDVVGTSPYRAEVTVCSSLTGPTSLPLSRWDTVVVTVVDSDFRRQLAALVPACRPGGRVVVFQRVGAGHHLDYLSDLMSMATLEQVLLGRSRLLWIARTPA